MRTAAARPAERLGDRGRHIVCSENSRPVRRIGGNGGRRQHAAGRHAPVADGKLLLLIVDEPDLLPVFQRREGGVALIPHADAAACAVIAERGDRVPVRDGSEILRSGGEGEGVAGRRGHMTVRREIHGRNPGRDVVHRPAAFIRHVVQRILRRVDRVSPDHIRLAPIGVQIQRTRHRLREIVFHIAVGSRRPIPEQAGGAARIGRNAGGLFDGIVYEDRAGIGPAALVIAVVIPSGAPVGLRLIQMIGDLESPNRVKVGVVRIHTVDRFAVLREEHGPGIVGIVGRAIAPAEKDAVVIGKAVAVTQSESGVVRQAGNRRGAGRRVDRTGRSHPVFAGVFLAEINAAVGQGAAVGVVNHARGAELHIDGVQVNDLLAADPHGVIGPERQDLAGLVYDPAVIPANLPADEGISARRDRGTVQRDSGIVLVGRGEQFLSLVVNRAADRRAVGRDRGIVCQIVDAVLLPVQSQRGIVVDLPAKNVRLLLLDAVLYLVPARVGVDTGYGLEGLVLGRLAGIIRVVALPFVAFAFHPCVGITVIIPVVQDVVVFARAGFLKIARDIGVLADRLVLDRLPEPGASGAARELAVVRVDLDQIPDEFPTRIDLQIVIGHGHGAQIRRNGAGIIQIPVGKRISRAGRSRIGGRFPGKRRPVREPRELFQGIARIGIHKLQLIGPGRAVALILVIIDVQDHASVGRNSLGIVAACKAVAGICHLPVFLRYRDRTVDGAGEREALHILVVLLPTVLIGGQLLPDRDPVVRLLIGFPFRVDRDILMDVHLQALYDFHAALVGYDLEKMPVFIRKLTAADEPANEAVAVKRGCREICRRIARIAHRIAFEIVSGSIIDRALAGLGGIEAQPVNGLEDRIELRLSGYHDALVVYLLVKTRARRGNRRIGPAEESHVRPVIRFGVAGAHIVDPDGHFLFALRQFHAAGIRKREGAGRLVVLAVKQDFDIIGEDRIQVDHAVFGDLDVVEIVWFVLQNDLTADNRALIPAGEAPVPFRLRLRNDQLVPVLDRLLENVVPLIVLEPILDIAAAFKRDVEGVGALRGDNGCTVLRNDQVDGEARRLEGERVALDRKIGNLLPAVIVMDMPELKIAVLADAGIRNADPDRVARFRLEYPFAERERNVIGADQLIVFLLSPVLLCGLYGGRGGRLLLHGLREHLGHGVAHEVHRSFFGEQLGLRRRRGFRLGLRLKERGEVKIDVPVKHILSVHNDADRSLARQRERIVAVERDVRVKREQGKAVHISQRDQRVLVLRGLEMLTELRADQAVQRLVRLRAVPAAQTDDRPERGRAVRGVGAHVQRPGVLQLQVLLLRRKHQRLVPDLRAGGGKDGDLIIPHSEHKMLLRPGADAEQRKLTGLEVHHAALVIRPSGCPEQRGILLRAEYARLVEADGRPGLRR